MQSSLVAFRITRPRPNLALPARPSLMMRRSANNTVVVTQDPAPAAPDAITGALLSATESSAHATTTQTETASKMFQPTAADNKVVQILAPLAAIALVAGGSGFFPARLASFAHLTAYATFLGTIVWNTFFVGLTMFKVLASMGQRQSFGKVQSKLFPAYFALTTGCVAVMLATTVMAGSVTDTKVVIGLGVSLALSLVNWVGIEPIATKLMFERYDLENLPIAEKTEETKAKIGALYKSFGKFHGISSLINLIITCLAFAHGWFLSSKFVL